MILNSKKIRVRSIWLNVTNGLISVLDLFNLKGSVQREEVHLPGAPRNLSIGVYRKLIYRVSISHSNII